MAAFKMSEIKRNRTLAWDKTRNKGAGGAVTTSDLMDDNGNVDNAACAKYGIDPKTVTFITVNDLPEAYRKGPKEALAALAAEWSTGKDDDGNLVKWTPDEVSHFLVLGSRMQDAANASIKAKRPVSDKALDKAVNVVIKSLKSQGKSQAEVASFLKMGGMVATDAQIAEAYAA